MLAYVSVYVSRLSDAGALAQSFASVGWLVVPTPPDSIRRDLYRPAGHHHLRRGVGGFVGFVKRLPIK